MTRLCACGCGQKIKSSDPKTKFILYHYNNIREASSSGKKCKICGVILSDETHSKASKIKKGLFYRKSFRICKNCYVEYKVCKCGCGKKFKPLDPFREYIHYHASKTRSSTRDYTGHPCIKCGKILDGNNHSSRSKLSDTNKTKRAYRICKFCLIHAPSTPESIKKQRARYRNDWALRLIQDSKTKSKKINREHSISKEYLHKLYKNQKGKCHWFNIPLTNFDIHKFPQNISIDRLNNNKGYIEKNVVLTSYCANIGRGNTELNTWKTTVKKIIQSIKND